MNPEVTLKIDALDNTKQAFDSVKRNISGVEQSTKSLHTKLRDMEPVFRKMAIGGGAAFAAIASFGGVAVKAAADAEVAWTKFDVVFGESAGDMREFVKQVRQDIPLAERVIAKMTAGLGDMLVPMGFARSEAAEMSKQFVSVAAGVAAFNNVDPSEVLNAVTSGLAGSGEALRRFGINADMGRLEMLALEMGLLQSGQTLNQLDSETRRYIQSQALLEAFTRDSSDAVAGLAKEKETLAFKLRDAGAQMQEMRETIGNALMPIITQLFDTLKPVLDQVATWIEENPELTRNIVIVAAAVAGLVAVIGTLSLLLLAFNPISIMIVGVMAAIAAAFIGLNNLLKMFGLTWSEVWEGAKNGLKGTVNFFIGLAESFANSWVSAVNLVVRALNSIQVSIPDWVPKIGGKSFGINIPEIPQVNIPRLAEGGIVTRSTLANIGEAGPEAVIPLDRLGKMGGTTYNVYVSGTFMDDRDAAKRLGREVIRQLQTDARVA